MSTALIRLLPIAIFLLALWMSPRQAVAEIAECPGIGDYRIRPFLVTAVELQALGRQVAIEKLRSWADLKRFDEQVIILCRMLFAGRTGGEFRRPGVGGAQFFGETDYKDWPLEPIHLHAGVPILITRGYMLAGVAESASDYLDYCVENCDWNPVEFQRKTDRELVDAVQGFLWSYPWRKQLSDAGRRFFLDQIRR